MKDNKILRLIQDTREGKAVFIPQPVTEAAKIIEKTTFTYNPDGTLSTMKTNTIDYTFVWANKKLYDIIEKEVEK